MNRVSLYLFAGFLTLATGISGVTKSALAAEDTIVAKGGTITITVADVRNRIALLMPDATTAQRNEVMGNADRVREIATNMLANKIMSNEAKAKKLDNDAITRDQIALARDEALVQALLVNVAPASSIPEPTEKEMQEVYAKNKAKLTVGKQYRLARIFVASPDEYSADRKKEAKRKIDDVFADLKGAKADQFTRTARISSEDNSTRDKGGEIGWIVEDSLEGPVRDTLTKMKLGEISHPINLTDGWYVFRLMETKPAGLLPFDNVKATIIQSIKDQKLQLARRTYADKLMQENKFEVKEDGIAAVKP